MPLKKFLFRHYVANGDFSGYKCYHKVTAMSASVLHSGPLPNGHYKVCVFSDMIILCVFQGL